MMVPGEKPFRQRSRGFTLWELMVVVSLVVFLFIAAIENLLPLRGDAERASITTIIGHLRSAVGLEATRRVLRDGAPMLEAMAGANPVEWLLVPPSTYAGTVEDWSTVAPGEWAFDSKRGVLFYRVRYPEYFDGEFTQPPGIRFRVNVTHGADGGLQGVSFDQLDLATWRTGESELGRWLEE